MSSRKIPANVDPETLREIRRLSGVPLGYVAQRVKVSIATIEDWEAGKGTLTTADLRAMADAYRKALAVFFLKPSALRKIEGLSSMDFRSRGSMDEGEDLSEEAIDEWNLLHERRAALIELLRTREIPSADLPKGIEGKSPSTDAATARAWLGLRHPLPSEAASASHASFNYFREFIEAKGIWVFQTDSVTLKDFRGAASSDENLPIILINMSDDPRARNFTLFHELGHILRGGQVRCCLDDFYERRGDQPAIEKYCNKFAAEALLPKSLVLSHEIVLQCQDEDAQWTVDQLRRLGSSFGASMECTLIRLAELKLISPRRYDSLLADLRKITKTKKPGGDYYTTTSARLGRKFTATVFSLLGRRVITKSKASSLLKVKSSNFEKLRTHMGLGPMSYAG